MLSGWFCFVQTEDGKVVAVHHAKDENDDAINFKKSVAAGFQANLKGTEEEEEIDPQSNHIAHYRYTLVGKSTYKHLMEYYVCMGSNKRKVK